MSFKKLDFVIIGAMKAGTTSLFRYLQVHPDIYMLPEKEEGFFTSEIYLKRGWDAFAQELFKNAPQDKLWGKASPVYLPDLSVPRLMQRLMPNIKVIVLLRNPVDRAFSHYKHNLRYKREDRKFLDAINSQLQEEILQQTRLLSGVSANRNSYIVTGEYGRLIQNYLKFIPKEQLLVIFTENLKRFPEKTYIEILKFLEVDTTFIPKNLNHKYHVSSTKTKIPITKDELDQILNFSRRILPKLRLGFLMSLINRLKRYSLLFHIWNVKEPGLDEIEISELARELLVSFYKEDVKLLESVINQKNPWLEFNIS